MIQPEHPVRVALIGCGRIGWRFQDDPGAGPFGICTHAAAWHSLKSAHLVAVADQDLEQARACAARWHVPAVYQDTAALLNDSQPQIVSIATPDDTHAGVARQCLEHPSVQAVFVEKPLAATAKEGAELCALATRMDKKIMVNYSRRFCPIYQSLRSAIQRKEYGRIRLVRVLYTKGLRHNGSHALDLMLFWFSGFSMKDMVEPPWADQLEDVDPPLDATFSLPEEGRGILHSLPYQDYTVFELDLCFESARLVLSNGGDTIDEFLPVSDQPFAGYRSLVRHATHTRCLKDYLLHGARHVLAVLQSREENLSDGEGSVTMLSELEKIKDRFL